MGNQLCSRWFIHTVDQNRLKVAVVDPGPGHGEGAAGLDLDAQILKHAAQQLDSFGIRAHQERCEPHSKSMIRAVLQ